MDYPDDQGEEVDDEAVECGDHSYLKTPTDYRKRDTSDDLNGVKHLEEAQKSAEHGYHQGSDANFFYPLGSFSGVTSVKTAPDTVTVGDTQLPVSRKYREAVQQLPMLA